MRPQRPSEDADTPRDPLLEAAFTHLVQQAQAPPEFAARIRARATLLRAEGRLWSWRRRVAAWLGADWPRHVSSANVQVASWRTRPRLSHVWTVVLATCLVLSLLGNVWLGVQLVGQARVARTAGEPWPASGTPQRPYGRIARTAGEPRPFSGAPEGPYGWIRLAFADNVREQDLRTLLLSLRATILAGPSPQGVYLVQVPLAWRVPPQRGSSGAPTTTDPMHLLLEELRANPAVRLAEPITPAE
jgi:hypothetical protein